MAGGAGVGGGMGGIGVGGGAGMGAGGTWTGGAGGVGTDVTTCVAGDACVLVPTNCCGYCSAQTLDRFVAVNAQRAAEFTRQICPNPMPCPACVNYPEPHYTATCRRGHCVAVDVRYDALGACNTSADCRLRWGAECCERCAGDAFGEGLTAVRASGFEGAVCGAAFACPDCAIAEYPQAAQATCTDGRCSVLFSAQ
jgi:hypothetical protein